MWGKVGDLQPGPEGNRAITAGCARFARVSGIYYIAGGEVDRLSAIGADLYA